MGNVEALSNIMQRGFDPIQVAAGIAEIKPLLNEAGQPVLDESGAPKMVTVAKYGMHALRHACASLWIEQGMNPKRIQKLMGHATIARVRRCRGRPARCGRHPDPIAWQITARENRS
jgi:integrase